MSTDTRIAELLELAEEEGIPLALSPRIIVTIEDCGWIVNPFTGDSYPDPDGPLAETQKRRDAEGQGGEL